MTPSKTFVFVHAAARANAAAFCATAPDGWMVKFSEPNKTRLQEEKYHAMIGDIAKQYTHCGRKWEPDDMKRLLVDAFRRDTEDELRDLWQQMGIAKTVPSIGGDGFVTLGASTKRFPRRLAIAFIDWLYAFGAEQRVTWSEPAMKEPVPA